MGVDLTLLPIECVSERCSFSHTVLPLDRDYALWDAVRELPSTPAPSGLTTYLGRVPDGTHRGEHGYGETTEDPYGGALRCATAGDLAGLAAVNGAHREALHESPRTRAAWAYLAALPPNRLVALYWC